MRWPITVNIAVDSFRLWVAPLVVVATIAVIVSACARRDSTPVEKVPERVVTLTPSVTEIVLALGGRDCLVGVDRFSRESAEVAEVGDVSTLPVAGDFVAPNVEVIARLRPDLIILDAAQGKAEASLSSAGYRTLTIQMHAIADVRDAVTRIAGAIGAGTRGGALVKELDQALEAAKRSRQGLGKRPRVLWVIDREPGSLAGLVAAGPGSYADELIGLGGGDNALAATGIRYPKVSRETLARLDPDLIIDSSGAAQTGTAAMSNWPANGSQLVAPLPTSAATPRPNLADSLGGVSALIAKAAALADRPVDRPVE